MPYSENIFNFEFLNGTHYSESVIILKLLTLPDLVKNERNFNFRLNINSSRFQVLNGPQIFA
jgi:hypothetical protein